MELKNNERIEDEWKTTRYSILNKLNINNWTSELRISKEYIIKRRIINITLIIK